MKTIFLDGKKPQDIIKAGEILAGGGLVAIPTETVYGLAADALNPEAVKKIFAAKGRPGDNPLIIHIADLSQWEPLVQSIPNSAKKLAEAFWPGPLTIILPKAGEVPLETSGGLDTVGVRFPAHPAAQAVIAAAGRPLAAPSANPSGRPSPTAFAHVKSDLTGRVDALLDGGDCGVGVESTVITLATPVPRVLRPGGVTVEQLRAVLGEVEVDPAVAAPLKDGERVTSPGMKYRHYAPKAAVTLIDASPEDYSNYVNSKSGYRALCFSEDTELLKIEYLSYGNRYDGTSQARDLFGVLYQLDEAGDAPILAHLPARRGVGLAVYNRLLRAAGFSVVNPTGRCVIGLTGPSGAGKSTVGEALKNRGWAVIDCDKITRSPAVYDADCIARLQGAFGKEVAPGGVLDRRVLAEKAFITAESKQKLEKIVFPNIMKAVRAAMAEAFAAGHKIVVLDAPTLFEAGLDSACGRIITVTAPEDVRLRRIINRDGITEEQARVRLTAQPGDEFYVNRSDYVLENGQKPGLFAWAEQIVEPVVEEIERELRERSL